MMEWEDYTRQEEENNESACKTAAQAAGWEQLYIDNCVNGVLNCPECPWERARIADKKCPECGGKAYYSFCAPTDNPMDGYDADYCDTCNIWLESKCSDLSCEFCSTRPKKPLDLLK